MVAIDCRESGEGITMSVLTIIGWVLVVAGAALLVAVVVRAQRGEPLPPIAPDPLEAEDLSVRQRMRVVRRAQGRGLIPHDQVTLVRSQAQHLADHPLTHELGFMAAGLMLLGIAALTWPAVSGVLLVVPGAMLTAFPLTARRQQRRVRLVLEELPPS